MQEEIERLEESYEEPLEEVVEQPIQEAPKQAEKPKRKRKDRGSAGSGARRVNQNLIGRTINGMKIRISIHFFCIECITENIIFDLGCKIGWHVAYKLCCTSCNVDSEKLIKLAGG